MKALLMLACFFTTTVFAQSETGLEGVSTRQFSSCFVQFNLKPLVKPKIILVPGCGTVPSGQSTTVRFRCFSAQKNAGPLWVIDGQLADSFDIKSIHPNSIERIDVLQSTKATALYGSCGANGVVCITTRSLSGLKLLVLDATDSLPVTNPTVELWTTKKKWSAATGNVGEISINGLSRREKLTVSISSVGYQAAQTSIYFDSSGQEQPVFLRRSTTQLDEVVIKSLIPRHGCCRLYCRCTGVIVRYSQPADSATLSHTPARLWPNPVAKEQLVNVQMPVNLEGICQVYSLSGQLLQSTRVAAGKGGIVQIPIADWPSGTYLLRVQGLNGKQYFTSKFVIQ